MTKRQKIILSASRDLPFNKLMLSQSNLRHAKAFVSIEELGEDISQRTLRSSITVCPLPDERGTEIGMYKILAGGRRFRALELLVNQKRMNVSALVHCMCAQTVPLRRADWSKTSSARRCIRSISFAPSRLSARTVAR